MSPRSCPFCRQDAVQLAFERMGRRFGHCRTCDAYVWLEPERTSKDRYADADFALRTEEETGDSPDYGKFHEFSKYLVKGSLLELGPGTGHFLAAARANGFEVSGIETSPFHRAYIRTKWGIETIAEPLEAKLPGENLFHNVVSFNCVEHVLDPERHFQAVHKVLMPGGRFIISTANAESLSVILSGRWWSMFKEPDHVNIMSRKSLEEIGKRFGLKPIRVWYSEYPLETPLGVVVSIRDWLKERKGLTAPRGSSHDNAQSKPNKIGRKLVRASFFSPVGDVISWLGLGASVKVVYEK